MQGKSEKELAEYGKDYYYIRLQDFQGASFSGFPSTRTGSNSTSASVTSGARNYYRRQEPIGIETGGDLASSPSAIAARAQSPVAPGGEPAGPPPLAASYAILTYKTSSSNIPDNVFRTPPNNITDIVPTVCPALSFL